MNGPLATTRLKNVGRTTMEFHLISDEEMVALANGKLVKQEHFVINNKKKKLTIWKLDSLCPSYLACVAVGYFREVVDGDYKYFAPMKYSAEDIYRSFDKTPKMVEWIQAKLGVKFPWPKYYQIACSSIPGAMENISLVTWSDKYLMDEKLALERKYWNDF
jgi:aminopeptidase N